nr:carbohydrate-binding domain-containing protein [Bacilli bacterium]
HSGGDVNIAAGTYVDSAADDGIHADATLNISGGTTTLSTSYEGLEASDIYATGGTTYVSASDDGWNASGGSDSTGGSDFGGTTSGSNSMLRISGGYHYVACSGDGLDSNGNLEVTGGFTVVSQSGNGNGPLDYGDNSNYFKQSGGFLAAYGSNDMTVSSTGTQRSILGSWSSAVSTSQYMVVTNEGISYAVKPQFAAAYSLYISAEGFADGSVTIASASSISGGTEVFKGVYTDFTASTSSTLASGTWSSSSINIGSTNSTEHGGSGFPGGR